MKPAQKKTQESTKKYKTTLQLPGKTIFIGPGTVPSSGASVSSTRIEDIAAEFRKASKLGVFDIFYKEN